MFQIEIPYSNVGHQRNIEDRFLSNLFMEMCEWSILWQSKNFPDKLPKSINLNFMVLSSLIISLVQ